MQIEYLDHLPDDLTLEAADFFHGWKTAPDSAWFRTILNAAWAVEVAVRQGRVIGFINAISDGVATAFIPWLEVIEKERGRGIGSVLLERMRTRLEGFYSTDLVCDADVLPFYTQRGWITLSAAGMRTPEAFH